MFGRRRATHCHLFAHVAKCGGTTLVEAFGRYGRRGICLAEPAESREAIVREAKETIARRRLSPDQVELFFGHRVHWGLHELSSLPPRYFTFLRDPTTRVVSLYNHHCGIADDPRHPHHARDLARLGAPRDRVPFLRWLDEQYGGNHMVRFLAFAMSGDDPEGSGTVGRRELEAAIGFLERCWFVGLTETSERDLPIVFRALGLKPPARRANVSRIYQSADDPIVRQAIEAKDRYDLELYRHAVRIREAAATRDDPLPLPPIPSGAERTR
ncbi:MAG TPA: sulfotransferase family 2 domain-containing protein [Pirellulaceae bacterium]|nr:sulfotransferase family 2 domain-containing protein [Pirellulaceae bacterium]